MKNIYLKIGELGKKHGRLVLATVISTRGSTPQKAGSSALFSSSGLVYGTIGGGILEGKVQKIAIEAALTGHTAVHHFELDKDISFKEEAICGGQASVFLDTTVSDHLSVFDEASGLLMKRIPCVLSTTFIVDEEGKPGVERIILSGEKFGNIPQDLRTAVRNETGNMISSDINQPGFAMIDFGEPGKKGSGFVLLESIFPPLKLIIAGAGHIGKSLCHIGSLLDFEVTVIDDRSDYANSGNLPEADHIISGDIEEAMISVGKNPDTYIVIVTRGHNDDARVLRSCIGSSAGYIGMIGSRTKIEKMHRNFVENGWATEQQWSEIHAPIGIDINSKTVEEIAISIAAELVMVRNRKKLVN